MLGLKSTCFRRALQKEPTGEDLLDPILAAAVEGNFKREAQKLLTVLVARDQPMAERHARQIHVALSTAARALQQEHGTFQVRQPPCLLDIVDSRNAVWSTAMIRVRA